MATAKKRGAPASASKPERPKKPTRQELKTAKSEAWRRGHAEELAKIRSSIPVIPERAYQGRSTKSNPGMVVVRKDGAGRPAAAYTEELDLQLHELILQGLSLEKISRLDNMPSTGTMLRWLGDKTHKFCATYAQAKSLLVPLYEERALDIATTPELGVIVSSRDSVEGSYIETRTVDMVDHRRLAFSAYQWALNWMIPRKHGRQAVADGVGANEQLNSLFDSLRAGPTE